jgi:hypothetical protein
MAQDFFSAGTLSEVAADIRESKKKYTLLFAYNATGKTRLSVDFKNLGKENGEADTLYFNAFTEDLFWWNNDLELDAERFLHINTRSRFFEGLETFDISNRIREVLATYASFNFDIDLNDGTVVFFRDTLINGKSEIIYNIKISRGEENLFYWCFFLAVAQLAIDKEENYKWVRYIYIDDPISSLDDSNAVIVAHRLALLLKLQDSADSGIKEEDKIKTVISTHHALFFNVLCNEFSNARKIFLSKGETNYQLKSTNDTPFIYHISMIQELKKVADSDNLYKHHFGQLRTILEKSANFHGFNGFKECMVIDDTDSDGKLYNRMVSNMNHGGYSLFEPEQMNDTDKKYFKQILDNYLKNYKFNKELFSQPAAAEPTA